MKKWYAIGIAAVAIFGMLAVWQDDPLDQLPEFDRKIFLTKEFNDMVSTATQAGWLETTCPPYVEYHQQHAANLRKTSESYSYIEPDGVSRCLPIIEDMKERGLLNRSGNHVI